MALAERDIISRITPTNNRDVDVLRVGCGQCSRAAAMQIDGELRVRSEHGGRTHETRIPVMSIVKSEIERADARDAVEVLQLAASRLKTLGIDVGFA